MKIWAEKVISEVAANLDSIRQTAHDRDNRDRSGSSE